MARTVRVLSPERLARLLESYGGASERWPSEEREAIRRLIARTGSAKRRWEDASYLDHLLDALEPDVPSTELVGSVLGASPARPPGRLVRRAMAMAASLAAAAAVAVWAGRDEAPPVRAAARAGVGVGVYRTATDVLLVPDGADLVPAAACPAAMLGCPDLPGPSSRHRSVVRARA
jgi:hypothetical protein